ncbi:unnamed protein product [Rhodiola kirilowii]
MWPCYSLFTRLDMIEGRLAQYGDIVYLDKTSIISRVEEDGIFVGDGINY